PLAEYDVEAARPESVKGLAAAPPRPKHRKAPAFDAASLKPQLATLTDRPPEGAGWVHEVKLDGYRVLAEAGGERPILRTRSGADWTEKFSSVADALEAIERDAVLDGEVVVLDAKGRSDFQSLQNALGGGPGRLVYYAFDLLRLDGADLRRKPLAERKA